MRGGELEAYRYRGGALNFCNITFCIKSASFLIYSGDRTPLIISILREAFWGYLSVRTNNTNLQFASSIIMRTKETGFLSTFVFFSHNVEPTSSMTFVDRGGTKARERISVKANKLSTASKLSVNSISYVGSLT